MLDLSLSLTATSLRGGALSPPAPNLLANSSLLGATSGTPGTGPTGWTVFSSGGTLTAEALAEGDGNSLRLATSALRHVYQQAIAAAADTVYALSVYVDVFTATTVQQAVSVGTLPAGAALSYRLNGASVAGSTSIPAGSGLRVEAIVLVGATAGTPVWRIGVGVSSNATGDLRLYRPKLEVGAAATAYLAT